eukprot:COSAG02_NODE_5292_length_4468_cov_12.959487_3_plen_101_part_00
MFPPEPFALHMFRHQSNFLSAPQSVSSNFLETDWGGGQFSSGKLLPLILSTCIAHCCVQLYTAAGIEIFVCRFDGQLSDLERDRWPVAGGGATCAAYYAA